jgi:translation elongation factor EF-4
MKATFGVKPEDVFAISAKTGVGIEDVLQAIITRIPPPSGTLNAPTKTLLFDSS